MVMQEVHGLPRKRIYGPIGRRVVPDVWVLLLPKLLYLFARSEVSRVLEGLERRVDCGPDIDQEAGQPRGPHIHVPRTRPIWSKALIWDVAQELGHLLLQSLVCGPDDGRSSRKYHRSEERAIASSSHRRRHARARQRDYTQVGESGQR